MLKRRLILFCLITILLDGCKTHTGELTISSPPSTQLFLNKINLPDSLSKSGLIHLFWSGDTKAGYIQGFEIAYKSNACDLSDNNLKSLQWFYTTKNDSSFIFPITGGQVHSNISFYARAIDNHGLKDLHPACLEIPVQNTPPQLSLIKTSFTDTIHLVLTLQWNATDADGQANLDSVYVKLNNGNWVSFSKSIEMITLIPQDPEGKTSSSFNILTGLTGTKYNAQLSGGVFNRANTIYVRAKDISNAYSKPDSTNKFYLKAKTGDLLILDSYKSASNVERSVYAPILNQLYPGGGYDIYDFNQSNNAYIPLSWNVGFTEYINFYKKIFWFSDANSCSGGPCTELGANAVQTFLNHGGKILYSQSALSSNISSAIYQIAPFDSISTSRGQVRIASGSKAFPLLSNILYDTLIYSQNLFLATPAYIKSTATPLYTSQLDIEGGWIGPKVIGASLSGGNSKPNVVFFSIDMHALNGNLVGLKNLFDQILNKEFSE